MRVRLDNIDHALARPGPLDNSNLPKVPVLRLFGLSSTGQRACLHVHQVYPYFFVDYTGSLNPDKVNRYIYKLTNSLNHAIALSLRRNPYGPNAQYIRAILLVKGVPFYGFHAAYKPFLKILVADPTYVSRTVTILQSGGVMRTHFITYENHLSYYLQFMSDFGIYGCGWVELGDVFLRGADDEDEHSGSGAHSSPPLRPSPYFKQSRMPLELDICAHQVLNRLAIEPRDIHSRLGIPAPPSPPDPLIHSVRELWEDERRRRIAKGLPASPDMPGILSESRRGKGGDWVERERLEAIIAQKCEKESAGGKVYKERNRTWEAWVMSTFESVEALWEAERRTWKPAGIEAGGADKVNPFASGSWNTIAGTKEEDRVPEFDVNEILLSSQEMNKLVRDEEQLAGVRDREDEEDDDDEDAHEADPDAEEGPQPELQGEGALDLALEALEPVHEPTTPPPLAQTRPDREAGDRPLPKLQSGSVTGSVNPASNYEFQAHRRAQIPAASLPLSKAEVLALVPTIIATPPIITQTQRSAPYASASTESPAATPLDTRQKSAIGSYTGSSTDSKSFANGGDPPAKRRKLDWTDPVSPAVTHTPSQERKPAPPVDLSSCGFVYTCPPPNTATLLSSIPSHGLLYQEYRDPHYSVSSDVPEHPREYAGLVFDLTRGPGAAYLPPWTLDEGDVKGKGKAEPLEPENVAGWEYTGWPPSCKKVKEWLEKEKDYAKAGGKVEQSEKVAKGPSRIEGPTQGNIYGFKQTPDAPQSAGREKQNMTVLAVEVFAKVTGRKVPNPSDDELVAVFYSFQDGHADTDGSVLGYKTGIMTVESEHFNARTAGNTDVVTVVSSELELINGIIDKVLDLDPDIVAGWEVQAASWSYLEARGRTFGLDVSDAICRAPVRQMGGGADQWGMRHTSTFKVVGRHVLNVWRLMRAELSLNIYTFENVAFQLLKRRVPKYTATTLTKWFTSPVPAQTARVFRYFMERTCMVLDILDAAEVITKTAEFARVFGVDFFSVISRGSQFKVESFMFRIAKPESFVLVSPSKADVGKQNAAECIPLVMEPYSAFYKGPLVVLDFQSLYPSVMIAYNYCYSTCLGRVQNFKGQNKFGVTNLENPPGLLSAVKDHLNIAPNGIIFVKPEVRQGLLGKMLTELLDTRVMVKQAMKGARGDKALTRILDARQLSLKFIANVTYGYTSATFSGRMPAVEIADAIVQSGRETLEKAIDLIESTKKWGARVVYGDTDSLFIYLQGRTKEQAFLIGNEMADTITASNPAPIKLKFEKVYLPCVLMAKKRYVGFKYERPDDQEPAFDAKGIETVRRDGIPAQQKMVERCLKMLFRSQDLSAIKEYCQMSWKSILDGSVSTQDFIFAKEVKMGTYSDKVPPPPGAAVAARRVLEDANDEPQYGERVPYVITRGEPGMKLVDRAVAPEEMLHDVNKHIDAEYYISRVLIPPLERIFNLMGADVRSWYDAMMRASLTDNPEAIPMSPEKAKIEDEPEIEQDKDKGRAAIDAHYYINQCVLCGSSTDEVVCRECRSNPQESLHALHGRIWEAEHRLTTTHAVCVNCTSSPQTEGIKCESLDCPWLYARCKAEEEMEGLQGILELTGAIAKLAEEEDKGALEEDGWEQPDGGSEGFESLGSDDVFL